MLKAEELKQRLTGASEDVAKRVDTLFKVADYHRKAMEARRTMAFQALLALFALYGAIFAKAPELMESTSNVHQTQVFIIVFAMSVFLAFLFTMLAIRKRNENDRQKYTILESRAWRLMDPVRWKVFYSDFVRDPENYIPMRKGLQSLREEWASSESMVSGFLLLLAVLYYVWLLGV